MSKPYYTFYGEYVDPSRLCPTCDGDGKVHSHNPICWTCHGTGELTLQEHQEGHPKYQQYLINKFVPVI